MIAPTERLETDAEWRRRTRRLPAACLYRSFRWNGLGVIAAVRLVVDVKRSTG